MTAADVPHVASRTQTANQRCKLLLGLRLDLNRSDRGVTLRVTSLGHFPKVGRFNHEQEAKDGYNTSDNDVKIVLCVHLVLSIRKQGKNKQWHVMRLFRILVPLW
jgi:hypothetical protein